MLLKLYNNHKLISLEDKDEIISREICCVPLLSREGVMKCCVAVYRVPRWMRPDKIIIDCLITARAINRDIVRLSYHKKLISDHQL